MHNCTIAIGPPVGLSVVVTTTDYRPISLIVISRHSNAVLLSVYTSLVRAVICVNDVADQRGKSRQFTDHFGSIKLAMVHAMTMK